MSATTPAGRLLGRGIAFPPRIGADGRVAWSEGEANVREGIEVVLRTEPGERLRLPEFGAGLARMLFEPNTTGTRYELAERVRRAVADWEPRVAVQAVEADASPEDPSAVLLTIAYQLIATQSEGSVTVSVALTG
ncbi:GPW/gp25 family protein [Streptomyces sp. NPDC059916]|uniref:GPW/gp25 family protein n=1 Tax=Streptomyces sp. NPDC059916 TaxID=3347001 RepID=UPI00369204F2